MCHFPSYSPKAMGHPVAMALIMDGAIDPSELKLPDHKNTIHRFGLNDDSFDNLVHQLCADMLTSSQSTGNF